MINKNPNKYSNILEDNKFTDFVENLCLNNINKTNLCNFLVEYADHYLGVKNYVALRICKYILCMADNDMAYYVNKYEKIINNHDFRLDDNDITYGLDDILNVLKNKFGQDIIRNRNKNMYSYEYYKNNLINNDNNLVNNKNDEIVLLNNDDYEYINNLDFELSNIKNLDRNIFERFPERTNIIVKEDYECSICKSAYIEDDCVVTLPCIHQFHKDCIYAWFELENNCPICLLDLRNIETS